MHPKKLIPGRLKILAKRGWLLGWQRFCPVCRRHARKFLTFGVIPRPDACCPACDSLERHRLVWLYFAKHTDLFDGRAKSMLHVAPEACIETHLKESIGNGYLTADLLSPRAMVRMDVTDIPFSDNSFDVI